MVSSGLGTWLIEFSHGEPLHSLHIYPAAVPRHIAWMKRQVGTVFGFDRRQAADHHQHVGLDDARTRTVSTVIRGVHQFEYPRFTTNGHPSFHDEDLWRHLYDLSCDSRDWFSWQSAAANGEALEVRQTDRLIRMVWCDWLSGKPTWNPSLFFLEGILKQWPFLVLMGSFRVFPSKFIVAIMNEEQHLFTLYHHVYPPLTIYSHHESYQHLQNQGISTTTIDSIILSHC